jgi:oxidase EvaA
MLAQSKGLVILKVRKVNQGFECLLTLSKEIGIDSGYLITATNVINPGEPTSNLNQEANTEILHEFVQSDEGGRFYKHESIYQILLVEGEVEKDKNQFWVPFFELKGVLGMSNMTSFQLRCISSLLLFHMNDSLKE